MLASTKPEREPKRKVRFRGLLADARALGVHRVTLWSVLTGRRPDLSSVMLRYAQLKATGRVAPRKPLAGPRHVNHPRQPKRLAG
jgi:hypothetical protein